MQVSERQAKMLQEMGIRVWGPWVQPTVADEPAEPITPVASTTGSSSESEPPVVAAERPRAVPSRPTTEPAPARAAAPATATDRPIAQPVRVRSGAVDVSQMDWPALSSTVQACTACGLCEERIQPILGAATGRADWFIVGEAPVELEDQEGQPFVGKPGQLLDNMLRAAGVARQPREGLWSAHLTHAVKCRPPSHRNPTGDELAQCEPYLRRQIELVQPRVIIAMGRFAAQSLLHTTEPIGRLRGRVHDWQGIPVVVTYHPAYLLRNPEDKGRAWDDLCLARAALSAKA